MDRRQQAHSGRGDGSLYRWKTHRSGNQSKKTTPAVFSASYHEKQSDAKKWIKSVDEAAEAAVRSHLQSEQQGEPQATTPWQAMPSHYPAPREDEELDAIAEANKLLSTYMASSSDPLAEVHLQDSHPLMSYQPTQITRIALDAGLDPLGEAQFVLSTLNPVPTLDIPSTSSALDAFIPVEQQVQHEVGSMLDHLMDVPIAPVKTPRPVDPQLQMEARHMQVKENRQRRHVKHVKKKESEQIQVDAKKLLAEQKSQAEAKKKLEDMLLDVEVKKLRKQLRQEKDELERVMKDHAVEMKSSGTVSRSIPTASAEVDGLRGDSSPPHTASSTASKGQPGKQRPGGRLLTAAKRPEDTLAARQRATRNVLEVQLKEAEEREQRDRLKLLHKVFTAWYGQVVQRRQQYSRVCATLNWRRLFRLWTRWQGALRTRQLKREEQEAARLVIREKRLEHGADRLHDRLLMRRCFWAWKRWSKQAKVLGDTVQPEDDVQDNDDAKKRMDGLLQALVSGALANKLQKMEDETHERKLIREQRQAMSVPSAAKPASTQLTQPAKEKRPPSASKEVASKPRAPSLITTHTAAQYLKQQALQRPQQAPTEGNEVLQASGNKRPVLSISANTGDQADRGSKSTIPPKDMRVLTSKRQTSNISAQPDSGSAEVMSKGAAEHQLSGQAQPQAKQRQPSHNLPRSTEKNPAISVDTQPQMQAKKSSILAAMEERTAAIAARKHQREQRKKEAEERRLMELRQIEEENRAAEEAEKMEALEKKREERRKQKKAERLKQEAVKKQQESLQMAKDHHLKSLLKFYGLRPWLKFMSDVRQLQSKAIESNDQRLIRCLFKRWLHCWKVREQGRLERADTLYRLHLLRSHLNTWLKEVYRSRADYQLATDHCNHQQLRAHFLAWMHHCRDLKRAEWEKERKALVHNNKRIKRVYFHCWRKYVPLQRQEAEQEKRRQLLRARVTQWLPDYVPPSVDAKEQ